MSIELRSECVTQQRETSQPLDILRQTFESRNATFVVASSKYDWDDFAVSLRVGPLGLDLRSDEAEALGKALIACARYHRDALAAQEPRHV